MHDASTWPRPTGLVILDGFLSKLVERARPYIGFDLAIPRGCVELRIPLAELREFTFGKSLNLAFEFLNLCHTSEYQDVGASANAFSKAAGE